MSAPPLKRCPSCGLLKGHSKFYRDTSNPKGLSSYCRPCTSQMNGLRTKAMIRLRHAHPREYQAILDELLEAARKETKT